MVIVLTKKQKHQMKVRRRKKKLATLYETGEMSKEEFEEQIQQLKQHEEPPQKSETPSAGSNLIIVPSNLSAKDAKKFRKEERRKARARGIEESKLQFKVEGEETEEPPKKKRKFPCINDLVKQQKEEEDLKKKQQAVQDADARLPDEMKEQYLALDCEMVGIGSDGKKSVLARVSITDWNGNVKLDTFVKVPGRVTDFRTHVSGVTPKHIQSKKAIEPAECRNQVAQLLKGKILVGHALKNDLHALMLTHPKESIRDTAKYRPFQRLGGKKWRPRKLRDLVKEHLDLSIQQEGESHDSVDDAKATMELFKVVREEWEKELSEKNTKRKR